MENQVSAIKRRKSESKLIQLINLPPLKEVDIFIGLHVTHSKGKCVLYAWSDNFIFIFDLHRRAEFTLHAVQVIEFKNTYKIWHQDNGQLLVLDSKGVLHVLKSPLRDNKPEGKVLLSDVLAIHYSEGQIYMLQHKNEEIIIRNSTLEHGRFKQTSETVLAAKSCKDSVETCHIDVISCSDLADDLKYLLFPNLGSDGFDVIFVSLGGGPVMYLAKDDDCITKIPKLAFSSNSYTVTVSRGAGTPSNDLLFFQSDNSIVRLHVIDEKLKYETHISHSNEVLCPALDHTNFFISDTNHSWHLDSSELLFKYSSLPVRGVIAVSPYQHSSFIVATRHRGLYYVDLSNITRESELQNMGCKMEENIEKYQDKLQALVTLSEQEDINLEVLSELRQLKNLEKKFDIIVKTFEIQQGCFNLDVLIKNTSKTNLLSKFWYLSMSVIGRELNISESQCLLDNFKANDVIRYVMQCDIKENNLPLFVELKLITKLTMPNGHGMTWFTLPLDRVKLNPIDFITPITLLPNIQEYTLVNDNILRKMYKFKLRVYTDETVEDIVRVFTKCCLNRMSALSNDTHTAFQILGEKVEFEVVEGGTAVVSCSNLPILVQVQEYLKRNLTSSSSSSINVCVDPKIIMKIQDLKRCLDFLQAKRCRIGPTKLEELYRDLRENITFCLPPLS